MSRSNLARGAGHRGLCSILVLLIMFACLSCGDSGLSTTEIYSTLHEDKEVPLFRDSERDRLPKEGGGLGILWEKTFGGDGWDSGRAILKTKRGFLIVGRTNSFGAGSWDVYALLIGHNGKTIWFKTYGGPASDVCWSACDGEEGGYYLVGGTYSFGKGKSDAYILKIDELGDKEWATTVGTAAWECARSVRPTDDGAIIVAGDAIPEGGTNRTIFLSRIRENGEIDWTRTIDPEGDTYLARSLLIADNGEVVVTGSAKKRGTGNWDVLIASMDKEGNVLWKHSYGGPGTQKGWDIAKTHDGGLAVVGQTRTGGLGESDVYLLKVDRTGTQYWESALGGPGNDTGRSILETSSGDLLVVGSSMSLDSTFRNVFLAKADQQDGSLIWSHRLGGSGFYEGLGVVQERPFNYVLCGTAGNYFANDGNGDVYVISWGERILGAVSPVGAR